MDSLPVGVRWEVVAGEIFHGRCVVHVSKAHSVQGEVPEENRPRHDSDIFGLDSRRESDQQVTTVERHASEGLGCYLPPDRVERDVHPAAVRRFQHGFDEVVFEVVDRQIGPEGPAQLDFLRRTRCRDHPGAARPRPVALRPSRPRPLRHESTRSRLPEPLPVRGGRARTGEMVGTRLRRTCPATPTRAASRKPWRWERPRIPRSHRRHPSAPRPLAFRATPRRPLRPLLRHPTPPCRGCRAKGGIRSCSGRVRHRHR